MKFYRQDLYTPSAARLITTLGAGITKKLKVLLLDFQR